MTQPGIPNDLVLSTACYGGRLKTIEDQAFATVAMGFRRLELGQADQPVPLNGWEDSHRETGICVASIVVGTLDPRQHEGAGSSMGSMDPGRREQAVNCARRHLRLAQNLRAPCIVVRGLEVDDPAAAGEARGLALEFERAHGDERDRVQGRISDFVQRLQRKHHRQIEHFCRSLHTLRREFPEIQIAVEPGRSLHDLLHFEAMQWTLDDLAAIDVGYWHDTGRIHQRGLLGLPAQGDWLDAYASRMKGAHLQDATAEEALLPPGRGEIDFRLVVEYVPRDAAHVIELSSRHGRAEVLGSVQYLMGLGL